MREAESVAVVRSQCGGDDVEEKKRSGPCRSMGECEWADVD